ncbi:MAG TPA: phenylalanine--tRNA ligase subunit beta [Dehalococcoidia bacterium]|nr:phenylalanine--tRNA ligase subunit beta [Dehalococcoidia bacterium]
MRVPLSWLSDYVDITLPPEELARRLTIAGVEVAEVVSTAGDWSGIRVALVTAVERHPDPKVERLKLVTVDVGSGESHTVVCGAPNVATGQKVAFAGVGTRLIDGHTGKPSVLKPAVIRGVESAGMVLSEKEMGISESNEGTIVLPDDAVVGAPITSVLGDTAFDVDVRANRPDLLSVLGVAREAAAVTGQKWRDPSIEYRAEGKPAKSRIAVEIPDPDLCPRYVAAIIENVTIADSPPWLQERLLSAGLRPINNIVDITNYVMLELGQPLHAFDYERVKGRKIIVRRARPGEKLTLLDGTKRDLGEDMLVIADTYEAVALAGVMGGADSEIAETTRTILLESANFKPTSIRRTSGALKARTDASIRFEKGISRRLPPVAAQRAVKLMVEICGGRAAEGLVDAFPGKDKDVRVTLTQERLHRVLGVEIPTSQVRQVLGSLGFGCRWVPPDHYIVRVPDWRTDVAIADDVIEEIARILGYDEMPMTLLGGEIPAYRPEPLLALRERVRDVLAGAGMQEVITYSLTDLETLAKVLAPEDLATQQPLRVANPMSRDHEYARTTLRGSVLQTLSRNTKGIARLTALFEASRVYNPRDRDLPEETETVCGVVTGRRSDRWGQPGGDPAGFYDAKGCLEALFEALRVPVQYEEAVDFAYLPGRTAAIKAAGERVGIIGEVHPKVASAFDIDNPVAMFEVDLNALLPHISAHVDYHPVPPYPSVEQDLAVIVPEALPAERVLSAIRSFGLVRSVSIFDIYTGPPVPAGRKSIAFSISYGSDKKTLTDEDVSRERDRIVARLKGELNAELRG